MERESQVVTRKDFYVCISGKFPKKMLEEGLNLRDYSNFLFFRLISYSKYTLTVVPKNYWKFKLSNRFAKWDSAVCICNNPLEMFYILSITKCH